MHLVYPMTAKVPKNNMQCFYFFFYKAILALPDPWTMDFTIFVEGFIKILTLYYFEYIWEKKFKKKTIKILEVYTIDFSCSLKNCFQCWPIFAVALLQCT